MDNQDLNIWLIKRIQTEGALRSEERRLDSARSEYNTERSKYQNARESFNSTRLRLLNDKDLAANHQTAIDNAKSDSLKLKDEKQQLANVNERLSLIEGKVRRQTVLVLQNKKKLEVLEERINVLQSKKAAKRNFREELEILDSRIQQIVLNNQKNRELKIRETENDLSEIKESEENLKSEDLYPATVQDLSLTTAGTDSFCLSSDSPAGSLSNSGRQQHEQQNFTQQGSGGEPDNRHNNQEFYEQIQNLSLLTEDGSDHLTLRYLNKSGSVFELHIRKQPDQGFIIEIKPHSKLDAISLNNSKSEIIESLKAQGLKLNRITVRENGHVQ